MRCAQHPARLQRSNWLAHICLRCKSRVSRVNTQAESDDNRATYVGGEASDKPPKEANLVETIRKKRRIVQTADSGHAKSKEHGLPDSNVANLNGDLSDFVKGFVLPKGYPQTVSDDYLEYQIRCLPAHITGWMSKSLATSSLIHALNIGSSASATVAASAAIKWITKDGIGSFGRFLVGGRLAGVFDEDPRRWRMIAVGFATLGLAFEIATTAYPANFIVLAGAGNFSKALGKGLSQPSYRIIQTHFAAANNVGDISAKEEVWSVAAQLIGLAASVAVLRGVESTDNPQSVLWIWAIIQVIHVSLRYYALKALTFKELNQKRAALLIEAYLAGKEIPDARTASRLEPILAGTSGVGPQVQFGSSIDQAFGGQSPSASEIRAILDMFAHQKAVLVWRQKQGHVLLTDGFQAADLMQTLLQASILYAQGVVTADLDHHLTSQKDWQSLSANLSATGWRLDSNVFKIGDCRFAIEY